MYRDSYNVHQSQQERQFYDAVFHRASTEFDQLVQTGDALRRYTHILELLLRLRQSSCHPLLIYSGFVDFCLHDESVALLGHHRRKYLETYQI